MQIAAKKCGVESPAVPSRSLAVSVFHTMQGAHEGWIVTFASKRRLGGPRREKVFVPDVEVDRALAVHHPFTYAGETAAEHIEALRKAFGL